VDRRANARLAECPATGSGRTLTRLVIDASAALYALSGPAGTAWFKRHEVAAPALLWSEVTSALRQQAHRGEVSPALARRALAALESAAIERVTPPDLYATAFSVATQMGWAKTYDAEYVALAQLLDRPLLTADARLARGAARLVKVLSKAPR
jgi:predicted nucleic acid-binding protein